MNKTRMLFLLALLSAFPPLSTDMYLPALPLLVKLWQHPLAIINLTLVCFFISFGSRALMTVGFAGVLVGGLVMLTRWIPGPWGLTLPMAAVSFCFGLSRPPSNNLVLEQVNRHAGAASSLLIFIYFMLGAFSMWLISLDWFDKIRIIGMLAGGVLLGVWLLLSRLANRRQANA